jgi:hypothetical protein
MDKSDEKKKPKVDWDDLDERDENRKHLFIMGRDVAEMPCFRNSFLYGIGGGIGLGLGKLQILLIFMLHFNDSSSSSRHFHVHITTCIFDARRLRHFLFHDFSLLVRLPVIHAPLFSLNLTDANCCFISATTIQTPNSNIVR